jgi:hypothetical protein
MAKLTHTFSNSHVEGAVLLHNAVSLLHQLHTRAALLLHFWRNQQQTCAQLHALPTGCAAWAPVTPVCHRTHRVCLGVKCTMAQNAVLKERHDICKPQWRTQKFFSGGVQQIQLTEVREKRDLGAVAP